MGLFIYRSSLELSPVKRLRFFSVVSEIFKGIFDC